MITYQEMRLKDEIVLEFAVVLPDEFDSNQEYPILLALPPGPQTKDMVGVGLDGYWASEAKERGWIVLSPIAPAGKLFFQGSEALIPEFLEQMATRYRPEGDKYHLGGISNGGISAFRIALNNPELFRSIVVLPGYPRTEEEFQKLGRLKDMPIALFVGELDTGWIQRMKATRDEIARLEGHVSLEIIPNEGHVIRSLAGGKRLFELLDSFR